MLASLIPTAVDTASLHAGQGLKAQQAAEDRRAAGQRRAAEAEVATLLARLHQAERACAEAVSQVGRSPFPT